MPCDDGYLEELLLGFYTRAGRDVQGRTHTEILAWSDALLEAVHDYIQWLFPLPEPSSANPSAPVLTPAVLASLRGSPEARSRLRAAWLRMLRFYGLSLKPDGRVTGVAEERARNWLAPYNHNHLRLTRMLRSLHLLGLEQESAALFNALAAIYEEDARAGRRRISPETYGYWERATR
jgi:hypothetical protein